MRNLIRRAVTRPSRERNERDMCKTCKWIISGSSVGRGVCFARSKLNFDNVNNTEWAQNVSTHRQNIPSSRFVWLRFFKIQFAGLRK